MTDDKLTAARHALSQIADLVTVAFFNVRAHNSPSHIAQSYGQTLASVREIAQDAAEATLDKVETRT